MNSRQQTLPRALTIAGSDSGGGAGIQADLKTFAALRVYGTSAITSITAQNTIKVSGIGDVSPELVAMQIDAVLEDIGADAIKIGMLHTQQIIRTVAERLKHHRATNIVLDPVMIAKSGVRLLVPEAIEALKSELLPLATLATPNLPEAEALLERSIAGEADMEQAARELLAFASKAVLIKGGHLEGKESRDCLAYRLGPEVRTQWFSARRVDTRNTHGTGCTLSSAIAAFLARGLDLPTAVAEGKAYLTRALERGARLSLGKGHGPLTHFGAGAA